jgi:two-component SAPR family response regulator
MAKITIVDSDKENVSLITKALASKEHKITVFNSSAGLMNSLAKNQTDIIIIGIDLENEDGRDLSKMLQLESVYKNIPVILTSPFYHTENEIKGFYCDDLVSLPFESASLTTSVEMLLAKEKARVARLQTVV